MTLLGPALIVHTLHVITAIVWAGAHVFMALVGWPTLRDRPAAEAQAVLARMSRTLGPLMAVTGSLVVVLGVLRGTVFGVVRSFTQLVETPYGRTFMLAALLTIVLAVHGARAGRTLEARIFRDGAWTPDAKRILRRSSVLEGSLLLAVIACMALMRFGL